MRKLALIILVSTTAFVSSAMNISAEDTAAIAGQAATLTGDDYRRVIAGLQTSGETEAGLREVIRSTEASPDEKLIARILLARTTHPEVFKECEQKIDSFRERQRSDRPFGTRPGFFSGFMKAFASEAPESRLLLVKGSIKWPGNPETEDHEKVEKYTEKEVGEGKSRNAAARLAVLEHFLKFSQDDSEYQQRELADLIYTWWRDRDPRKPEDRIQGTALLCQVYDDETRPLSVRAAAMSRVPANKRKGERELMLDILRSPKTCNELHDGRVVRQAIDYLKQNDPDSLKKTQTKAQWKQSLINEVSGLPKAKEPESAKETQDVDIVIDMDK